MGEVNITVDWAKRLLEPLPRMGTALSEVDFSRVEVAVLDAAPSPAEAGRWTPLRVQLAIGVVGPELDRLGGPGMGRAWLEERLSRALAAHLARGTLPEDILPSLGRRTRLAERLKALDEELDQRVEDRLQPSHAWQWMVEIGLVVPCAAGIGVTRSGEILLGLRGADALRWVLHLEVRQSTGARDPWRVPAGAIRELLRKEGIWYPIVAQRGDEMPWSNWALARLTQLGLAEVPAEYSSPSVGHHAYSAPLSVHPILEDVVADPPSSLGLLAESVLREQRGEALASWGASSDHEATRFYRTVARALIHNIRHDVEPSRWRIDKVISGLDGALDTEEVRRQLLKIREALDAISHYAKDLLTEAELGRTPAAPFDLRDAIEAAARATARKRNGRVRILIEGLPDARPAGRREQFVRTLGDLFDNAAESRPDGPVTVRVHGHSETSHITLYVDDDGPGIEENRWEEVFQAPPTPGVRGNGLPVARQLLRDIRGDITCRRSPMGGARLILHLPAPPRTS